MFAKLLETRGLEEFRRRKGPQNSIRVIYCEKTGHFTVQSLRDRETLKVYTQFERGIVNLLNRGFKESDFVQAKILLVKECYQYLKPKIEINTSDQ